jgi:hypothetical protein
MNEKNASKCAAAALNVQTSVTRSVCEYIAQIVAQTHFGSKLHNA